MEKFLVDLRKYPRANVALPVASDRKGGPYFLARDISMSGVRLESSSYIDPLKEHTFVFTPIDQPELKLKGVPLWWKYANDKFVYGIKFNKLGMWSRYRLSRFVRRYTPLQVVM